MPRAGSGAYTLPSAVNPVVDGEVIEATWANTTLNDIATALSDSLSRSGSGVMTAQFKAADGTVSAPGISFGSDLNCGFYRAGADDVSFTVGGVDIFSSTATVFNFDIIPATAVAPTSGNHLTNKTYVDNLTIYAPVDSPTFTTSADAPTPAAGDDSTSVATTAWVNDEIAGAWDQIGATRTLAGNSTEDFKNGTAGVVLDSTYDEYMFVLHKVKPGTDNVLLTIRTSADGTTYDAGTGYDYQIRYHSSTNNGASSATLQDSINITSSVQGIGNVQADEQGVSGVVRVLKPAEASYTEVVYDTYYVNSSSLAVSVDGYGYRASNAAVVAVRFLTSSGTLATGTITMYGRRK